MASLTGFNHHIMLRATTYSLKTLKISGLWTLLPICFSKLNYSIQCETLVYA